VNEEEEVVADIKVTDVKESHELLHSE